MQRLIKFCCLVLELGWQTCLKCLKVGILLLKACLNLLCLLTSVGILLQLLLEISSSWLQSLTLLLKSALDVLTLLFENQWILLAELILCHDRVNLNICNLDGWRNLFLLFSRTVCFWRVVARSEWEKGYDCCSNSAKSRCFCHFYIKRFC